MGEVRNITINKEVAIKVGVRSAALYDYLLFKFESGRYFLDIEDIFNDMPILGSKRSIEHYIFRLVENGFLKEIVLTNLQKYKILSSKKMVGLGVGNKTCEWCGCKTTILNKHHYPLTRIEKGTKTVNICPNCHYEFHHLTTELIIPEVN